MNRLALGDRCVRELRDELAVPGPLLSHHLAVLRDAGIVVATRRGRWIDYTLEHAVLAELVGTVTTAAPAGTRR